MQKGHEHCVTHPQHTTTTITPHPTWKVLIDIIRALCSTPLTFELIEKKERKEKREEKR